MNAGGRVTGVLPTTTPVTITITARTGGGKATCTVTVTPNPARPVYDSSAQTLTVTGPQLVGVNHFGNDAGTTDYENGSYTFDGTAVNWSGGGAQYSFPAPKSNDAWKLSDFDLVEITLAVADSESVSVGVKKSGNNIDLKPYPDATNQITLTGASTVYKTVVVEAGAGIGFQRSSGGPATVSITKVVFSKGDIKTVTFEGGEHTTMTPIDAIKVPSGRTLNWGGMSGNYVLRTRPTRPSYTFAGWQKPDNSIFSLSEAITTDLTLTATWETGEPPVVDMKLGLDPGITTDGEGNDIWSTWMATAGITSMPVNGALTGGSPSATIPADFAIPAYANNKLTLTFNGLNRQRAIVPLSAQQVEELMWSPEAGVTFRIVGVIEEEVPGEDDGDGNIGPSTWKASPAEFRCHLADPTAGGNWNGTDTGNEGPLANRLVEYRPFSTNKKEATLRWFTMQAMYNMGDGNSNNMTKVYPTVRMTIDSITIEMGDTTTP